MENILLVLNIIFAVILVLLVLMQKSEGGALGIGVSENLMFSKTAGNFMTKATAIVATLFIICSLALTIVSRGELVPTLSFRQLRKN